MRVLYINGDLYIGNAKAGKRNGFGTLISKNFNYTGEWSDGNMTGVGEKTFLKGNKVLGYFSNGEY